MKKSLALIACVLAFLSPSFSQQLFGTAYRGGAGGGGTIVKYDVGTKSLSAAFDFTRDDASPFFSILVPASNGLLYGMTNAGGIYDNGGLFSFNPITETYKVLKAFQFSEDGFRPYGSAGLMQATDGKLYGTNIRGGSNDYGELFSFDPLTETYSTLFNFEYGNRSPVGNLVQAVDGKLYGATQYGGTYDKGILFSYDPSSGTYSQVWEFNGTEGANPTGNMVAGIDGKLYGLTEHGGANGAEFGADGNGVIFSFDPASGNYNLLWSFDGPNGTNPKGSLIQASDGKFYGMTNNGGTVTEGYPSGVLFSFDAATRTFNNLFNFNEESGSKPLGNLFEGSDGKLYGMTNEGGSYNTGVLFSYDPLLHAYYKIKDLNDASGNQPYSSVVEPVAGKLFGMTDRGGAFYAGAIFSYSLINNDYTVVHSFGGNINGIFPRGGLVQGPGNLLYGTTSGGGNNNAGVIYAFNPPNASFEKLYDFDGTNGGSPLSSLVLANNGKLYGSTSGGGAEGFGVIFSFDPATRMYTVVKTLMGTDGVSPYGSPMQAANGKLYGMTFDGGKYDDGVIYSFDPTTGIYTVIKEFDGPNGSSPTGDLFEASNGILYGMTPNGSTNDYGVIFSLDPTTSGYTVLKNFTDQDEGKYPNGGFIQAPDGKLYATTGNGGSFNVGVLFSFEPVSAVYTKLAEFTGAQSNTNGRYPTGTLFQSADGTLYGKTWQGGTDGGGTVFSYKPATGVFSTLADFTHATGLEPLFGSFVAFSGGVDTGEIITEVIVEPSTKQYSDKVTFSATLTPANNGSNPAASKVTFYVGTQNMGTVALTNTDGKLRGSITVALLEPAGASNGQMSPGLKTVKAVFTPTDPTTAIADATTTLTIKPEDAKPYYTGALFTSATGKNSNTATITLSATVKDISAEPGMPGFDSKPGDIRNATVTFTNRATGKTIATVPVGLTNADDIKTGTATYNWVVNTGSSDTQSYTIGIKVGGYYKRNDNAENAVVTIVKSEKKFAKGDGNITTQNSAGMIAADAESKASFSFDVNAQKNMSQLEGYFTATITRTENGAVKTYEISSTDLTSLAVNDLIDNMHPYPTATLNGEAKIVDITALAASVLVDDNATLQITMTDVSKKGTGDKTGITVWNKAGGLWYSSNWDGTRTIEQLLKSGNIKLKDDAGKKSLDALITKQVADRTFLDPLDLSVSPNPTATSFKILVQTNSNKPINLRVTNASGVLIEKREKLIGNQTISIGDRYATGIYFAEVIQGTNKKQIRLLKIR